MGLNLSFEFTKIVFKVIMSSFVNTFVGDTRSGLCHFDARQRSMVALITNSVFSVLMTK